MNIAKYLGTESFVLSPLLGNMLFKIYLSFKFKLTAFYICEIFWQNFIFVKFVGIIFVFVKYIGGILYL